MASQLLKHLRALFNNISATNDAAAVDAILADIDSLFPISTDNLKEAKFLIDNLNSLQMNETLITNAKTRRRIKRISQRIGETFPGVNFEEMTPIPVEEESIGRPKKEILPALTEQLDASSVVKFLQEASSAQHVERALNGLSGPTAESKAAPEWLALKEVLFDVLANERITNKIIRRRISRLIFVLSEGKDADRLQSLKKESAAGPAGGVGGGGGGEAGESNRAKKRLAAANAVAARNSSSMEYNASSNRNDRFMGEPVAGTKPPQAVGAAAPAPAPEPVAVRVPAKAYAVCLQELQAATSCAEVDAAISAVSASSEGDEGQRRAVGALLQQLESRMAINTKTKRKVLRLIKSIEEGMSTAAPAAAAVVAEVEEAAVQPKATPAPAAATSSEPKDVLSIVKLLKEVRTAEQLDSVLISVDLRSVSAPGAADQSAHAPQGEASEAPSESNTEMASQRRLLKRTIDEVLSISEVAGSMNSKVRRRVTRITAALQDADGEGEEDWEGTGATAEGGRIASVPVTAFTGEVQQSQPQQQPQKKVPYVAFVGNLSYDVTAAEVEEHFRAAGALEGEVRIRLRTDPHSGRGLGVAFVEVDSARELHQCIAQHHSRLGGRMINVEKSCGGRNKEQRGAKIADKRSEQQRRVEETMMRALAPFEQRGVLRDVHKWGPTLKEKVFAHSPAYITEVSLSLVLRR
jgi:hypothetical protein